MDKEQVKRFLERGILLIDENLDEFLEKDPVNIPSRFSKKEDKEIAGFLTAIIAWGQRKSIINNANKLMGLMDEAPHDFIVNHQESDLKRMNGFVHRTFNDSDLLYFLHRLQKIYKEEGGLEEFMLGNYNGDLGFTLSQFKKNFFAEEHLQRSEKHLADPLKKSTAKRLLMYLRWNVRNDLADFGIWKKIKASDLLPPIDVHSAKTARELGLLERKQNDWNAVIELANNLKAIDENDPVKYDYVLYGVGAFEFLQLRM